jgi:hypothetical protein
VGCTSIDDIFLLAYRTPLSTVNFDWNSPNRGVSCRNGQLTGAPSAVKAGLIRFYRGVTGLHSALGF